MHNLPLFYLFGSLFETFWCFLALFVCAKLLNRNIGRAKQIVFRKSVAHLAAKHVDADKARALREVDKDITRREVEDERKAKDETAMAKIPIYSLRTKQKRKDFLEMVSNGLCNVVVLAGLV